MTRARCFPPRRSLGPDLLFTLLAILLSAPADGQSGKNLTPRVSVLPVFFIPTDAVSVVSKEDLSRYGTLMRQHLAVAQKTYQNLLETDTFAVANKILTVHGANESPSYDTVPARNGSDADHIIAAEVLRNNRDNRTDSRTIYLTLFVRPGYAPPIPGKHQFGGGRTFNGPPGSGGGIVVLEMSSLTRDEPYPFQSTLVHELGHAFGLTHPDCFGYDMSSNNSLMSYNLRHHTKGLEPAPVAGTFNPEEFYELSLNKLVFPYFNYNPTKHNPQGKDVGNVDKCFLGPMSTVIGDYRRIPGKGYELFFNGKLVSGPEAAFYTWEQARKNCKANDERHDGDGIKVECRYNGKRF